MNCFLDARPRENLSRLHGNDLPEGEGPVIGRGPENRVRRHVAWECTPQICYAGMPASTAWALGSESTAEDGIVAEVVPRILPRVVS